MTTEIDEKYPLHAEMKACAAEREGVQQAIDWISEKGYFICGQHGSAEFGEDNGLSPIDLREGRLVAAIMGIDYAAFNAEKDAMLREITALGLGASA